MAMALVLGLMLGGGLGLVRDWMDQRLRSADEVSAVLGVPVLGVVPSMPKRQDIVARGQKTRLDSDSREAEAFRTIRTAPLPWPRLGRKPSFSTLIFEDLCSTKSSKSGLEKEALAVCLPA